MALKYVSESHLFNIENLKTTKSVLLRLTMHSKEVIMYTEGIKKRLLHVALAPFSITP